MKKRLWIGVLATFLLVSLYLQYETSLKVISSFNTSSLNYKEVCITIIANKYLILDKAEYSNYLFEQYKKNNLSGIRISDDLGSEPQKITFVIYTNWLTYKVHKKAFSATYYSKEDLNSDYVLEID
ncbi:hypothetical protein KQH93_07190 [Coprococcus comes]|nr:hypothetical protein [Coprococcus comes]